MDRASGILLPVSALPSPGGIGTLGRAAYDFVDFLAAAGQKLWQILPLGPTGYGDSPYSSFSTFAGNPYFVDLETLAREGLLDEAALRAASWGDDPAHVDYGRVYELRFDFLRRACDAARKPCRAELAAFAAANAGWLPDYALFMALKRHFGMAAWTLWPDEAIRLRESSAMEHYRELLAADIELFTYIQFEFFRQWDALRAYAHAKGVRIVGDLPIYVAPDSADVWAAPEFFQLDARCRPERVAGVPPDYFSADGQLWGNPLYRWERLRADGFGWWIRRVEGARRLYDILRIDHFRGFESYWSVPAGESTARNGRWEKGPGLEFVSILRDWFRETPIIAEDLGFLTPEVSELLRASGFPGMKVLEFAFDAREPSDYLPHNYTRNCVCYVGTHDNETLAQWFKAAAPENIECARRYLGLNAAEGYNWGVLRGGMSSVADVFIVQMQDLLGLGAEARMNVPGTAQGNWRWRLLPGEATPELAARLREQTRLCAR